MSAFKPVNLLSPKGLKVLSQLTPVDELLVRRDGQFYALNPSAFFEEPVALQGEVFFAWTGTVPAPALDDATSPVVTLTIQDAPISLPAVQESVLPTGLELVMDMRDGRIEEKSWTWMEYLSKLEVQTVRLDPRSAYVDWASMPAKPTLRDKPHAPAVPVSHPTYQAHYLLYREDLTQWQAEEKVYRYDLAQYPLKLREWLSKNDPEQIVSDGRHRQENAAARVTGRSVAKVQQQLGIRLGDSTDDFVAALVGALQEIRKDNEDLRRQVRTLEQKLR